MGRPGRGTIESSIFVSMSRNMETNLTYIGRKWRYELSSNSKDPIGKTRRRDMVEILLSHVFFMHMKDGEFPYWPPQYVRSEEFMVQALECRVEECADSFDYVSEAENKHFNDAKALEEIRLERLDRLMDKVGKISMEEFDAQMKEIGEKPIEG